MKAEIEEHVAFNLARVRGMIELCYRLITGPGRPPNQLAELLRAAVITLHATLEDALRQLHEWKLPTAPPAAIPGRIPLNELAQWRGQSVDDALRLAVQRHLTRASYSTVADVESAVMSIGLDKALVQPYNLSLAALMARRHLIAHRADRNEQSGRGHRRVRSIDRDVVRRWADAVDQLVAAVLTKL